MSEAEENVLREFFNASNGTPLGPTAAFGEISDTHRLVFDAYFDRLNYSFKNLSRNPVMIVGRRGAGKTDILLNYAFAEFKKSKDSEPTVYFAASAASNTFYSLVSEIAKQATKKEPRPLVESVADFWSIIFWTCIFDRIANCGGNRESSDIYLLRRYLSDFGIAPGKNDPYSVALRFIVKIQSIHSSRDDLKELNIFSVLPLLMDFGTDIHIDDVKRAALNTLRQNKQQTYLLFDSFEQLDVLDSDIELALSGFLRAVAAFQQLGMPIDVRCCIPAEAYFKIIDLSSNVMKDFGQSVYLHWSSGELMRIAAIRAAQFLKLWEPEVFSEKFADIDLSRRTQVVEFWSRILPDTVPNSRRGARERTLPYILRHTQLLPRQLLAYLNAIFSAQFENHGTILGASPDLVVKTIRETEHLIVTQIVSSYGSLWPEAEKQLRSTLIHLNSNIISFGDLHRAFIRGGIAGQGHVFDVHDFIRMLSELGAIGRMINRDGEYAKSVFEYSEPHKLSVSENDTICLHPVFTEHFGVIQLGVSELPSTYRAVYPLGSDPDDEDRRRNFS